MFPVNEIPELKYLDFPILIVRERTKIFIILFKSAIYIVLPILRLDIFVLFTYPLKVLVVVIVYLFVFVFIF